MKRIFSVLIVAFTLLLVSCNKVDVHELVYEELEITYTGENDHSDHVTNDISLVTESVKYPEAEIDWVSSNESALKINDNLGIVTRDEADVVVTLTVTITYKGESTHFDYDLTIIALDKVSVEDIISTITIPTETKENLELLEELEDVTLVWESSNVDVVTNKGVITRGNEDETVTITLTATRGEEKAIKHFTVKVLAKDPFNFDLIIDQITLPLETDEDLELPVLIDGVTLTWKSSNKAVLTDSGVVTRTNEDVTVTLSLNLKIGNEETNKTFIVKVLASDEFDFESIFLQIDIPNNTITNLTLPTEIDGVFLSWQSNNTDAITNLGEVTRTNEDVVVILSVIATKGEEEASKDYLVTVNKKSDAPESTKMPIVDVREKSIGSNVEIHGVATSSMSNGNFTVQDSTGAIPVYFGSGNNSSLKIGTEYIISGKLDNFQGLIQIASPKVTEIGTTNLPDVIDISEYSLDFEDITHYEGYIVNYSNLEVTGTNSPNNAHELNLKNLDGETGMTRLDLRVNSNTNHFKDIKVGEIVDLENVTVGQYDGKAQFMFTSRSKITARPKDPNMPQINGAKNLTYVIGIDSEPNYLEGVTANNANGVNYTSNLQVDSSKVNLNTPGTYEVVISVVGVTNYPNISTTITIRVRNEAQIGDYEGYYESLSGLTGSAFNAELARLIKNTGRATGTTSQVKQVDNFNGQNYNIYTGFGGYGNREHVWPQSKLGSVKDDLHNLRAAIENTNSKRGNYPFILKPSGNDGKWERVGSGFYPGDEHVGDVARIVLYISIRYNLSLNLVGNLQMFLKWHEEDPVSPFELSRNDKIESIQRNRNPFIDHPELVEIYFG